MEGDDMPDWIAAIHLDQVALAGIVTLGVVMILRGLLVPRSHLLDAYAEREAWKSAYLESEKARTVYAAQSTEMLELARTSVQILRSLPGGESHVVEATQPAPPTPAK